MASTLKPDYTARDRDAALKRALKIIRTHYPDWSDETIASFGNMILSIFADFHDSASFYSDKNRENSRLSTTRLREIAVQHAAFLGYDVKTNAPAEGLVEIELNTVPSSVIEIDPNSIIFSTRSNPPIDFVPTMFLQLAAGTTPPKFSIPVENSQQKTEVYVSSGDVNQVITVSQGSYISNSVIVSAGGEAYTAATSILTAGPLDPIVRYRLVDDDKLQLIFGDGARGKIPQGQIVVTYKYGGGRAGIVDANTITSSSVSSVRDINGNVYSIIAVNNLERTEGGDDRETINSIKEHAPKARLVSPTRTIASIDYTQHAEEVKGVSRAYLLTHRNASLPPNQHVVIVVPTPSDTLNAAPGQPSEALKSAVLTAVTVTYPGNPAAQVTVTGPTYKVADIIATVWLKQGVTQESARAAIESTLYAFFSPRLADGALNEKIKFGSEYVEAGQEPSVSFHQILSEVQEIPQIHKISGSANDFLVNNAHADLQLTDFEFPKLGTITLFNAATGQEF